MMVTFVSQCEKKSLAKTRRVLDAFANRIGSRTWQTVITNEGLQAVKKLLRKTASKNTAVSCHWIRSRSRSEFLWVVGTKSKFNAQGFVPVNFTTVTELNIDEIHVMTDKIYANTHEQPLDQHLFAVGYLAYQIIMRLVEDEKLATATFIVGCWHDMGKIDPAFQNWLAKELKKKNRPEQIPEDGQHIDKKSGKDSPKQHPRHNEISFLLFLLLNRQEFGNDSLEDLAKHAIYWHHAKWIRAPDPDFAPDMIYSKLKKNIGDANLTEIYHAVTTLSQKINAISQDYNPDKLLLLATPHNIVSEKQVDDLDKEGLPPYKQYRLKETVKEYQKFIGSNANNNLARTAVVTADRLVSGLSRQALADHIEQQTLETILDVAFHKERGLKAHIQGCLKGFDEKYPDSERNKQQKIAANYLADEDLEVGVLEGPAGCGKTKIALEWAANTSVKKIIWICPRVQVCQGLMHDLTHKDYLYDAKIEIHTGEFKFISQAGKSVDTTPDEAFSGDIVITTIDQMVNSVITHRNVATLVQYMDAHVVFDEYHEYINMSGFNLLFAELVKCKQLQRKKAQALLVSATPNYYFVKEFLEINAGDIESVESFNQGQYKIAFSAFDEKQQDQTNPLYQLQPDNTFIISNTATGSQASFITNQSQEKAVLLHSKYKKSDKQDQFEKVFNAFKQDGDKAYDILRAGPIVQASLNISCDRMVTEFTHAENWLQRMGRLNRFGLNEGISDYITAIPQSIVDTGKQKSGCAKFLNSLHSFASAKAWHAFLQDKLSENSTVILAELYQIYREFYKDTTCLKAVEEDFLKSLKESVGNIQNNVFDPVSYPKKIEPKDQKTKIKKHSLRGNNRFVQMAIYESKDDPKVSFTNQYAYTETDLEASLTESVERICGYGDNDQDLLAFMVKKHHNIKEERSADYGVKSTTKYKNKVYLNKSRDPATPIYLSYTPEDLKRVETSPHPNSIYYAIGNNQPIGAISLNKLNPNSKKEN